MVRNLLAGARCLLHAHHRSRREQRRCVAFSSSVRRLVSPQAAPPPPLPAARLSASFDTTIVDTGTDSRIFLLVLPRLGATRSAAASCKATTRHDAEDGIFSAQSHHHHQGTLTGKRQRP